MSASRRLTSALAVLVIGLTAAGWIPSAEAATPRHVYLAEGHSAADRHYKPKTLTLSGDSTLFIKHGRWHHWNSKTASGSARTGWNYCTPDCARGRVHWFLAKVTLSKPKLVCGHEFFTVVRFHFTQGRPKGIPQDDTYDATPAGRC